MSSEYRFDVINGYPVLGDVNGDGWINSGDIQRIYGIMATQSAK